MTRRTKLLVGVSIFAGLLALAGAARAFWTTQGSGVGSGQASTLHPPTGVAASSSSTGSVEVTWVASSTTGAVAPTGYHVERFSGATPTNACGSSAGAPLGAVTSCTDTGVAAGTYTYEVTAIYRSWTAGSAPSDSVTLASAAAAVSPTSGIVGSTVVLSGAGFPADSTITATYDGVGISLAGNATTTSAGAIPSTSPPTFSVPAATAGTHLVVVTAGALSAPAADHVVVPAITLTPTSGVQGSAAGIAGTGFGPTQAVTAKFDGVTVPLGGSATTNAVGSFSGATYTVPSHAPGAVAVSVSDASAGVASATFTVTASPSVSSVSPTSRGRGAASQDIAIIGTNFVSGATAAFSGAGITVNSTTFTSATSLTANVSVASGATLGAQNVTVTNPDGGVGSCTNCFTVNAGPTVTSTNPSTRGQGAASVNVTIAGSGFVNGASAELSGSGIIVNSTTWASATSLTANVSISTSAAVGSRSVTVTNPDAGVSSCSGCFTVAAGPTVASISPSSRGQGATSQVITVTGSNFVNNATVAFSGTGITVNSRTFVNSTTMTANITVAANATVASSNVTVTNPDAGVGTCTSCFSVNAAPTVVSATSVRQGATADVTISGTGFASGAGVIISGSNLTVNDITFVNATTLTANVTAAANASAAARTVTVTNPDAGFGSCTCFTVSPRPTVTAISPASVGRGTTTTVTITGTGFATGAAVSFSGSGITVIAVTFVSSTSITADISVATGASTGGKRDVTVTNADGSSGSGNNLLTIT